MITVKTNHYERQRLLLQISIIICCVDSLCYFSVHLHGMIDVNTAPNNLPELQSFLSGHNVSYNIVKVRTGYYKLSETGKATFLTHKITDHTYDVYLSMMSDDYF